AAVACVSKLNTELNQFANRHKRRYVARADKDVRLVDEAGVDVIEPDNDTGERASSVENMFGDSSRNDLTFRSLLQPFRTNYRRRGLLADYRSRVLIARFIRQPHHSNLLSDQL